MQVIMQYKVVLFLYGSNDNIYNSLYIYNVYVHVFLPQYKGLTEVNTWYCPEANVNIK